MNSTTANSSRLEQREVLDQLAMRERRFRYSIAAFVLVFAAIALVTLLSEEGPRSPGEIAVVGVFALTTIPVGLVMLRIHLGSVWWSNRSRRRFAPELFLLYADTGLTAVLLTFQTASGALFGTMLFAIIGTYGAHFVIPVARIAHILVSSGVIVGFGLWGIHNDSWDLAGGMSRILVALFVVNGTVALHGAYTREVRRAIAHNHRRATTDPLTGIANRRAFEQRARHLIESSATGVIVLLIDVDDFKIINDTRGHDHGDQTLARVAESIRSTLPAGAVVARLGGDEFAVAVDSSAVSQTVAADLRRSIAGAAAVNVSIGRASASGGGADSADALSAALSRADTSLYQAKGSRKAR